MGVGIIKRWRPVDSLHTRQWRVQDFAKVVDWIDYQFAIDIYRKTESWTVERGGIQSLIFRF